jgi:DNA-binding NtrC family response regulator
MLLNNSDERELIEDLRSGDEASFETVVRKHEPRLLANEMNRLKGCLNDVVAMLTLDAVRTGREPGEIVGTLLDALLSALRADFVYASLKDTAGDSPIEIVRFAQTREPISNAQSIIQMLHGWLRDELYEWPSRARYFIEGVDFSLATSRLGLSGESGVIVAGCRRADFPQATETVLLNVAANQAILGLQASCELNRQKRIAAELEEKLRVEERVESENLALREEVNRSSMFEEIVGSSQPLREVLGHMAKVAPTDSTVLITGETGTGKELVARAIHRRSNRAKRAFISVNCGAIPSALIASEMFGHEKGAFTGAMNRRAGRFEAADGGTIFLDEVGELPMETQTALLRVLQEREFERVGSTEPLKVDVRVVAATNRDLSRAVLSGAFREDLFYRLNVFPLRLPSLRERADDIPLLVEYLIDRYSKKAGKKFKHIGRSTLDLFQSYDWPGNVRELQNVVERAVILCDSETFAVDQAWLRKEMTRQEEPPATLKEKEKRLIEVALIQSKGRISGTSGAAAKLGIARQTVESKIMRLGINKHRFRT